MFPVFRQAGRPAFDPALLANDFQIWMMAFKENIRRRREEVKTAINSETKPPVSERDAFLAMVKDHNLSPSNSPASSFISSFSSNSSASASPMKYFSNEYFEVRPSPKGGLGAFAIKEIPIGTLIIAEKALFRCHEWEEIEWKVDVLPNKLRDEYYSLHRWEGVDQSKVHGIFKTNRFETGSMSGIFLSCSRFNHACHPHTTCTYTWNEQEKKLIVSTLRDIFVGEELTISYMGWKVDRQLLKHNYGFECDCPGCVEAKEDDKATAEFAAKLAAAPPRRRHPAQSMTVSDEVVYYKGGCTILEDSWLA